MSVCERARHAAQSLVKYICALARARARADTTNWSGRAHIRLAGEPRDGGRGVPRRARGRRVLRSVVLRQVRHLGPRRRRGRAVVVRRGYGGSRRGHGHVHPLFATREVEPRPTSRSRASTTAPGGTSRPGEHRDEGPRVDPAGAWTTAGLTRTCGTSAARALLTVQGPQAARAARIARGWRRRALRRRGIPVLDVSELVIAGHPVRCLRLTLSASSVSRCGGGRTERRERERAS